jgi:PKD repeat protein
MNRLKDQALTLRNDVFRSRTVIDTPTMFSKFEANRSNGSVPPDNTIGVSHQGFVISAVNSNILIGNAKGDITTRQPLADFFRKLRLSSNYFDPKIIYDQKERRFIVISLVSSNPSLSHVAIAVSKSEDPGLGWNFYKVKGDLENDDLWFDYPNVAVNNKEIFITGNMFTGVEPNRFRYSAIIQIDKNSVYKGETMKLKHYTSLKNDGGGLYFNLTTSAVAYNTTLTNQMLFVTTRSGGSESIAVTEMKGTIDEGSTFSTVAAVPVPKYSVSPRAGMKDNPDKLQTGDNRVMYALLKNRTIHFVFNALVNGSAGIFYGRYNLDNKTIEQDYYSEPESFLAFPSIAELDVKNESNQMIIHFLRSNSAIFPEMAAVKVDGESSNFEWSNSVLIRQGQSAVTALTGDERWGDYSSSATRFNENYGTEVWVNGCYGLSSFASFTAQFIQSDTKYSDFFPKKTVVKPNEEITFSNLTNDTLTDVKYTLQGSTLVNEAAQIFAIKELGSYDATMEAVNVKGEKIRIFKPKFIHVLPPVIAPVTEFSADKTVIFVGDTVQFFDESINEPDIWNWALSGATPPSSSLQNPKIVYNRKGNFNVVLGSSNSAGTGSKVKSKYITVNERITAPNANFSFDKSVVIVGDSVAFTDISTNTPTQWSWLLTTATDTISSNSQNPVITFTKNGVYSVKLIASNTAGSNEIIKADVITVSNITGLKDHGIITDAKLFPNPTSDKITYDFTLESTQNLEFNLIDNLGRTIKTLLTKRTTTGRNELTFSTLALQNGLYRIIIKSDLGVLKAVPFIVKR